MYGIRVAVVNSDISACTVCLSGEACGFEIAMQQGLTVLSEWSTHRNVPLFPIKINKTGLDVFPSNAP
jgi:hypothetical protein